MTNARANLAWLVVLLGACGDEPPVVDERAKAEPVVKLACSAAFDQLIARSKHGTDDEFRAARLAAIVECSSDCDAGTKSSCALLDTLVETTCKTNPNFCEATCIKGGSPWLTAAACKHMKRGVTEGSAWKVGDRVEGKWTNGKWYPGVIAAVHEDGSVDVNYDDGDKSKRLPVASVKKSTRAKASQRSGTASTAACGGPGINLRCNGVCVNIQEDNNHCGACNNRCGDGYRCDGHMTCRNAAGGL